MSRRAPFDSIYRHGFLRVAIGTPRVALADPATNAQRTIELAHRAVSCKAALVLFPELGLSGYSNEDLVLQDALLDGVELAVKDVIEASHALQATLVAGAPLRSEGKLFNCALVIHHGRLLGVVPKTYLPNYREFYEKRQYTSGCQAVRDTLTVAGQQAPFGSRLLFVAPGWDDLVLHVEICARTYRPSKVAFLARQAWSNADRGEWPEWIPAAQHRTYDLDTIKHWLEVFIVRFFQFSQFKRSALPNGPKVGSGGSLSPRGDWRAPSDVTAKVWLEELHRNVP